MSIQGDPRRGTVGRHSIFSLRSLAKAMISPDPNRHKMRKREADEKSCG
jgi:hypothetical protein